VTLWTSLVVGAACFGPAGSAFTRTSVSAAVGAYRGARRLVIGLAFVKIFVFLVELLLVSRPCRRPPSTIPGRGTPACRRLVLVLALFVFRLVVEIFIRGPFRRGPPAPRIRTAILVLGAAARHMRTAQRLGLVVEPVDQGVHLSRYRGHSRRFARFRKAARNVAGDLADSGGCGERPGLTADQLTCAAESTSRPGGGEHPRPTHLAGPPQEVSGA
jgi:hypothetical protein